MDFLMNPLQRDRMEIEELKVLIRKALGFFVADRQLWKKDSRAKHKLVIDEEKQLDLLRQAVKTLDLIVEYAFQLKAYI